MMKLRTAPLVGVTGIAGIATLIVLSLSGALLQAQTAAETLSTESAQVPDWQTAAGGMRSFDVASVKPNALPPFSAGATANFPLEAGNGYTPDAGFLSAKDFSLSVYIAFAYKLTAYQTQFLDSDVPKWATVQGFDIQARADGKPTKDQMRLMMQSLLADRFKLAVHFETRQLSVFALVLAKPGKMGPQLQTHPVDVPCKEVPESPPKLSECWYPCDNVGGNSPPSNVHWDLGGRDLTMERLAGLLGTLGRPDRPVVDHTGLSGKFDFSMQFFREPSVPQPNPKPDQTEAPDQSGPTFLEALQEQLGLKLESSKGPVEVLVIDHAERPSEN